MAWEIVFSIAFLAAAGVFALFALKAGETVDPISHEITRSGKIFRYLFATLAFYLLVLGLGGATFAADGSPISTNTTVQNAYVNVSDFLVQDSCSNGTVNLVYLNCSVPSGNFSQSVIKQTRSVLDNSNSTLVSLESNPNASALATSGFGIVLDVIELFMGLFLIGFILEFFGWFNEWREKQFRKRGR